ncbi:hypothetical protein B9G69_016370 [Bdellovibrio sp. SKB1291214]|uniref:hypothetical protein n=1 Tax=Bdellovibrio sp. SKB1291214 TaxID=1732569 RepID=UPI0022404E67|nr:hypothetical protein [Bdellovibrio sp. SKB1291214]UYL08619.1 hypothetical protein B9G69_016370 [Bdellovibrio sp. SKB1291214]
MKFNRALSFALISNMIFASFSHAISKELQDLVTLETKSNAVTTRSDKEVMVYHYDIPMSLVEADIAKRAPQKFVDSLVHEEKGVKYLRWIINPEDTKWWQEIAGFLKDNGITPIKKVYYKGYMTASRSYIIVDPVSKAEFSFKGSTDKTGGFWRDKHQDWDDGKQIRMMTDFVDQQLAKQPKLYNIVLLDEPLAFGIETKNASGEVVIDQGMIIRSYDTLTNSGKTYVPGFSIMHEEKGRELARLNGSNNPAEFWNEHYNKPLARAIAEFFALTGMTYDSPHSQNFLVELDEKMRPTGKIVLRDYGDTYLNEEFFEKVKRTDILKAWEQSNLLKGFTQVGVGILHGNTAPSWMPLETYNKWGVDFFQEFEKEFKIQTGVEFVNKNAPSYRTKDKEGKPIVDRYRNKQYVLALGAGKKFLDLAEKGQQRDHMTRVCSRVFSF